MKILCLLGSPRLKGNSAEMAKRFILTAESLGAETRTFALNSLHYRGCQVCYACKEKHDRCVLDDDLAEVIEAVKEADVLVLATPVYYGDISSQLKTFIDRTFSLLVPDYITNPNPSRLKAGKKLVFIIAQGHPDETVFADIFPRYEKFLRWYGFQECHLVRACGVQKPGDVGVREDVMKLTEETARKVMGGNRADPAHP
jgi:multimeric flavodoxin WrbA